MKTIENLGFGMKDIINAECGTKVLKNFADKTVLVKGFLIADKEDVNEETGETKVLKISVLKCNDMLISSVSPTVANCVETIIDTFKSNKLEKTILNDGVKIKVKSDKTSKGRDFFYLELE